MSKFFLESNGRDISSADSLETCIGIARRLIPTGNYKIFDRQRVLVAYRGADPTRRGRKASLVSGADDTDEVDLNDLKVED
jgi:hypothetical protein